MKTMIILFVLAWQGAAGLLFAQKLTLEVRGFEAIKGRLNVCLLYTSTLEDEWLVPRRYLKRLDDSTAFNHVVFVDRLDQNITTLERVDLSLIHI